MAKIWAGQALLADGWSENVCITVDESGAIAAIESGVAVNGYVTGILLPAPANAHSHAFQRAMAGLTEKRGPSGSDSFWTWRQLMFRFLDRLTPEHVESIAAFVQMEMLEAGYAANVEFHYLHHQPGGVPYDNLAEMADRIVAATQRTGIGLTLLPVHYQYGGCDRRPLTSGQIRFGNDLERFVRLHAASQEAMKSLPADCVLGVAPHSLRAVAAEDTVFLRSLAGKNPMHMHLAEQRAEVDEVAAVHGRRPVEWVLDNMDLQSSVCFIHCTQMLPHETLGLARSGAIAGLCPLTESSLGDGVFDGVNWTAAGGAMAIGSDSNIRISLVEELRTLEYSQRLRDRSRASFATSERSTGRRLFEAINHGGALAAGRAAGAIVVGNLADLMALDSQAVDLVERSGDTLLDCFVFAGHDRMITDVWSDGRHQVRGGRHVDQAAITKQYLEAMKELRQAI